MDQGFQEAQRMNCPICWQAQLVAGLTSVHLKWEEMNVVINHVPSHVCPGCGEAYVEEQVAEALLQVREISETGVTESVIEYNSLS
jgi:YgiT-type zinc finger domain-containing protein